MTAGLLAAALALLAWPDAAAHRRRRLRTTSGTGRLPPVPAVPTPPVAAAVAGLAAGLLGTPLVGLLAAVAAFLGSRAWLSRRRDTRSEEQIGALAEGLSALAAELRAGRTLEEASGSAAAACGDPVTGRALIRTLHAPGTSPGVGAAPLTEALGRIDAGVLLSARTGCSLAAVAAAIEDDLRARLRQREELRAATAAPRASALLLAGLPVLGLAMGSGIGADPWGVLTTTPTGQVLLVAGVALELAGIVWSGRLVRRALR
ncbi:type II secretion system F family protein [Blastococcus sp. PRF04-17]|uniref:type II secretion system F family protein n=1 Tax=Blastococcus sp. PRF04-17 TaxID=2933797 RepID=UPI001FF4A1E1|nr:pilus assembly protein TadB [Blastococcus sp. PRF04-17]UOY00041.1 pilus assembly protein TadB [Blastococcus sp. PRF04-17]